MVESSSGMGWSGIIGILIIIIGIIIFFVILPNRRKKRERVAENQIEDAPSPNQKKDVKPQKNECNFTLAELKRSSGKYSWDESGCVFEINSDGSVTVVGHFDPAELLIDPKQQLYDSLVNDGLLEMLPVLWGVYDRRPNDSLYSKFWLSYNNSIAFINTLSSSLEDVRDAELSAYSSQDEINPLISVILKCNKNNIVFLLPSNEQEFILSLGAQSCIHRHLGNQICVKISSPSVMGALGVAIKNGTEGISNISFAFGEDDYYNCCNLIAYKGICEVKSILSSSIILPLAVNETLLQIAKGCMTQSLILAHEIKDFVLLDMFVYPISLLVKENDRVIWIYELCKGSLSIPTRQTQKNIFLGYNQTLSLILGTNEIIPDIIEECEIDNGTFEISAEIDTNMSIKLIVVKDNAKFSINIGGFIG